ncbi:GtrA family protein [Paenibacillus solani]|uniref:GtrA family protein n=1 Tax=Paenibacillus solani TaxID=1705565 RepID=UPI003D29C18B
MRFILKKQFIRFAFIGLLNTGITYALYLVFLGFFSYQIAYAVSYISGIIISFFFNTSFVFRSRISILKFLKYPLVYVVQFILNWIVLKISVNYFGIHIKLAPLIVIIISIPVTFALTKFILEEK